jgi:hypothetical protein
LDILNHNPIFITTEEEYDERVAKDVASYSLNREFWEKLCGK